MIAKYLAILIFWVTMTLPGQELQKLKSFSPAFQGLFKNVLDKTLVKKLEKAKNLEEAVLLVCPRVDKNLTKEMLTSWLKKCEDELLSFTWGGKTFKELSTTNKLNALGSYLLGDKKLFYKSQTEAKPYLLSHLLTTREGNCATLPLVFTLLADRLKLPVHLVCRPRHAFARYDDGTTKINIETTNPEAMGVGTSDEFYITTKADSKLPSISQAMLENTTYMKSLNLRESISFLFVNNTAYINRIRKGKEIIPHEVVAQYYFNPDSMESIVNLDFLLRSNSHEKTVKILEELRTIAIKKGILVKRKVSKK